MMLQSSKRALVVFGVLLALLSSTAALSADRPSPANGSARLFVDRPSELSAPQANAYAQAQASAAEDEAFLATGMGDRGVTGLEVLGILFLIGLAGTALAVAASSGA